MKGWKTDYECVVLRASFFQFFDFGHKEEKMKRYLYREKGLRMQTNQNAAPT